MRLLLFMLRLQVGCAVIHGGSGNIFLQGRGDHKSASSRGKGDSAEGGHEGDYFLLGTTTTYSGNETQVPALSLGEGGRGKSKGASSRSSKGVSKGASKSSSKSRSYLLPKASGPPTRHPTVEASLDADIPARSSTQCQASGQEGTFGVTARGEQSFVVYIYQVETEPQITQQQFATQLLPQLELATLNAMIPYMFGRLCPQILQRQQQVAPLVNGKSFFLGISMQPDDGILDDGKLFFWLAPICRKHLG
jgi:hypothetical protein